jgi:hypothetical protein
VGFWQKKQRFTEQQWAVHVTPWVAFTGIVDSRGEGVDVSDKAIGDAYRVVMSHYGVDAAESMSERMVEAVESASNELERMLNLNRLIPPIESCPTCNPTPH